MKPEGRKLMKRGIAALLTAGCFTVWSLSVAPAAKAADVFTLTSPAVQDNGMLAVKNAGSDKQRSPNCVGENVSPPLTWSNPPEGTKTFALLLFDPAVNILSSPLLFGFRAELCRLNMTYKLPAIGQARGTAEAGCLASYGINFSEFYAMAANLTDKMLKGARPAETPAEQPTKFELVINQRTAHAIGVEIPQTILGRADEVIE